MPVVRPLAGDLVVTDEFGDRIIFGQPDLHEGVDYRAREGDLLYAIGDGVVEKTNETQAGGRQLFLQLDDGSRWAFSHLLDVGVSRGQRVAARQVVGLTGGTGRVTAPHLHVQAQLRAGGPTVDPDPILRRLPSPTAGAPRSSKGGTAGLLVLGVIAAVAASRS